MKKINVYFISRYNHELNLITAESGEDAVEKIKTVYSMHGVNQQGFSLTVLIEEKDGQLLELIFLVGHLVERVTANIMIKKFMQVKSIQKAKVHGHCKMSFITKGLVTFGNEGHTYLYPHASALISFAGYLGLGFEFNGDETLPFQEVKKDDLK